MLGRPSRRPLSVVFEQQTARQQTAHGCADDSSSDARLPLWISQLTRTKANVNLGWLDRFEGGVVSACASLRRCAAAPLRRCAAAPLRRCAAAPLRHCASLASLAFLTSASVAGVAPRDAPLPLECAASVALDCRSSTKCCARTTTHGVRRMVTARAFRVLCV